MALVQAFRLNQGDSFIWKGESYVIIKETADDNSDRMIVHRTVGSSGNVIQDAQRHDENFNPYAYVEKVLK